MKLQEAYQELGLNPGASEEEAKKAFKSKAKLLHPDNKETGSEEKFKKINEAYERIKTGQDDPVPFQQGSWAGGFNINDIISSISGFGGFGRKQGKHFNKADVNLYETITFRESVVGCTRNISFKKDDKCYYCDGAGGNQIDNGCKKCKGQGVVMSKHGNMITQSVCNECHGKTKQQNCDKCNGQGFSPSDAKFTINIPPGITPDKNVLNIGNVGHYCGSGMMGDQYTRVLINMTITPLGDLKLVENGDVVGHVSISLLEALEGCVKPVMTMDGERDTTVIAGIRNKDEIVIPKMGLSNVGNHRVIVDVEYPKDVWKLIEALKDKDVVKEDTA